MVAAAADGLQFADVGPDALCLSACSTQAAGRVVEVAPRQLEQRLNLRKLPYPRATWVLQGTCSTCLVRCGQKLAKEGDEVVGLLDSVLLSGCQIRQALGVPSVTERLRRVLVPRDRPFPGPRERAAVHGDHPHVYLAHNPEKVSL